MLRDIEAATSSVHINQVHLLVRSRAIAAQFDECFATPAIAESSAGRRMTGARERIEPAAFAAISPLP